MKKNLLFSLALAVNLVLSAQRIPEYEDDNKAYWRGDINGFLNQQAKLSLNMAADALDTCPPAIEEPAMRKMALMLIDNVLHEEKAPNRPAVSDFLIYRYENAIREIRELKVEKGAVIWKLYNHTFVVKTPSVTIGFDIQRGFQDKDGYVLKKKLVKELIDVVDILFISHKHSDHADAWVAESFVQQNKPVISPPELWNDSKLYPSIQHPDRVANKVQDIKIPGSGITLRLVVFPGHQGENVLNNVYLVITPENISFAHTGDQLFSDDFAWIDHVADKFRVDVLMVNTGTLSADMRLPLGFRPALIIPGHEDELGHNVDRREPYWLNPVRLGDNKIFPWVELFWGEKYLYLPARK